MLTARQLTLRLLRYTGVTQLGGQQPEGSLQVSYDTPDGYEAVACINAALQEIFALAPRWFSHRPMALAINGPTAVTFSATQGSATIASANPSGAFVRGCTLKNTSGDPIDNEVVSPTQLLRPYTGPTGTVTGTIYGDCLPLPASVSVVNPPVELEGYRQLWPAATYEDLLNMDYRYRAAFGNYGSATNVILQPYPRTVSQPLGYLVDTFFDAMTGASGFALRFVPIPAAAYAVRFEARMAPPVITIDDLGGEGVDDPNRFFGLPGGWDESILLPVALQRWTGSSLFNKPAALPEIKRGYDVAMGQIVAAARPQGVTPQRLQIGCR